MRLGNLSHNARPSGYHVSLRPMDCVIGQSPFPFWVGFADDAQLPWPGGGQACFDKESHRR